MKAPAQGPRPTVVVVNGMDNAKEMSIFFCGLEFARRGYNTLCLDGPGMGETRRMRDMASRFDYEVPARRGVRLSARRVRDVDAKRVAIMGYSFGGYYSSRIAAFEKRYAACIALSALHWDLAAWQQKIKDANRNAPKSVAQSNFQWRWVAGAKDEDEGIEIAKKFSLKDVAKNITCPFLVTHGGNDRVVPVENAQKLYDAVGSKNKTIKIFTTEEGGAEHAHVDNRQIGIDFAADWLEKNSGRMTKSDSHPHGRLRAADHRLFPRDEIHRRPAGRSEFGDRIAVKYVWNIMDFGYRADDILWLVEDGILIARLPVVELSHRPRAGAGFVDLPFLFADTKQARAAMDGALGKRLAQAIERETNFRILGWFENGFRHISNRVRTVRTPADLKDMTHPRAAEQDPGAHVRAAGRRCRRSWTSPRRSRMITKARRSTRRKIR